MKPTIGRIVHYRLSESDVTTIKGARESRAPEYQGNNVREGDVFPAMIVAVWGPDPTSAVNLQVFLDGRDSHWATSVCVGEGPRTFAWPTRD